MATPSIATIESELSQSGFLYVAEDYSLNTLFTKRSFKGLPTYGLYPEHPAIQNEAQRLFPDCWKQLSYGQLYIVLMRMSRAETLDGKIGKQIRQILEVLAADEECQNTLDDQLARIAVHLQKPVHVWVSGHIKSGILEDFLPPIYDGDKIIREGVITVSLHYEPLTITGAIPELFESLLRGGTFRPSRATDTQFEPTFDPFHDYRMQLEAFQHHPGQWKLHVLENDGQSTKNQLGM